MNDRHAAHLEWLNNPFTREQDRAITMFINHVDRLQEAIRTGSQDGLRPGDLDYRDGPTDVRYVVFPIPRSVWERYGESEDAIKAHVIATAPEDQP